MISTNESTVSPLSPTNESAPLCLTLGRTQAVFDLHRVVLRDVTGGLVEHPALSVGRQLLCFPWKTFLHIPAVPRPRDTAVTDLQRVAVLEQQAERGKLLAAVSVVGEPLTLHSFSALGLTKEVLNIPSLYYLYLAFHNGGRV